MRIKVITKDHGEYTSDVILDASYDDALSVVEVVSKGQSDNLSFNYAGGRMFFTSELLKTSLIVVMKD